MPNRDDPVLERIESRLARLGLAIQEATALEIRLAQIERRAPNLRVILSGARDNLQELYRNIYREFSETTEERDRYRQDGRRKEPAIEEGKRKSKLPNG